MSSQFCADEELKNYMKHNVDALLLPSMYQEFLLTLFSYLTKEPDRSKLESLRTRLTEAKQICSIL